MNIGQIVRNRKCVCCGMCCSICPTEAIKMSYDLKYGLYFPVIEESKCINCGKCINACPSQKESGKDYLGNYMCCYLAHSTSRSIRYGSTSGGVINSLVRYILEINYVEAVLLVSHDAASPIEASPCIITKSEQGKLFDEPREFASRYVVVPLLQEYKKLCSRFKKVAIVGTPCQIKALGSKIGKNNVAILKIGITCSAGISYFATEEYKNKKKQSLSMMYYRGNGWPGQNTLKNGSNEISCNHTGSLFEQMFSSQIFKNPACRTCRDHFAEEADISFCDFWNEDEMRNEKNGNSVVIIRSDKANIIFREMEKKNYIEIVREVDGREVVQTQLNILKAKKGELCKSNQYKLFCRITDFVFKYRLFRNFGIRTYQRFARYYIMMCKNQKSLI